MDRVRWLVELAQNGVHLSVHFTPNMLTGGGKVKVLVHRSASENGSLGTLASNLALDAIRVLARYVEEGHLVTDRGHRHTSGISEVSFWVRPRGACSTQGAAPPECGPTDPACAAPASTKMRKSAAARRTSGGERALSASSRTPPPATFTSAAGSADPGCTTMKGLALQDSTTQSIPARLQGQEPCPGREEIAGAPGPGSTSLAGSRSAPRSDGHHNSGGELRDRDLLGEGAKPRPCPRVRSSSVALSSFQSFEERSIWRAAALATVEDAAMGRQKRNLPAPSTTESGMPIKQLSKCLPAQAFSLPWMSSSPTTSFDVLIADSNPPASRAL